jgi:alkylation response protein AidB-like acyl-CoA dehydrogenase
MVMRFPATRLTPAELTLQAEVRAFLARELPPGTYTPGLGMASGRDPAFSRKLGEQGWLGMSLPRAYGGGERTLVDRFVVVEELLRWGAPVGYHWVADRQSGPTINRFGTDEQRQRFLPAICRGELSFAIGMSEPDSGSDLASLRTAATRVDGGWLLNGTKVWTSGARTCDWLIVLARTSRTERPQAGLTQFLVDRRSPGLTVRPITFIDGTSDFCEVSLRDVPVPDELVLGTVGEGWAQNTAELAFERGGPDRLLSNFNVLLGWLANGVGVDDPVAQEWLGDAVARFRVMRSLSLAVARMADAGRSPVGEAALVKEMATRFEQDVTAAVSDHYGHPVSPDAETAWERLLARAVLTGPSFTIRGGTTEILRTVVARHLAADPAPEESTVDALFAGTVERIFTDTCGPEALARAEADGWAPDAWRACAAAGLPWLSLPESAGGSGGELSDALELLYLAGRHAVPLPLAETGLLGGWLLTQVGAPLPEGPVTVAAVAQLSRDGDGLLGTAAGVAWARAAEAIVVAFPDGSVAVCPQGTYTVEPGTNLAGEPRDRVSFAGAPVTWYTGPGADELRRRGALTRIWLIAGALAAVSDRTGTYTGQREQFGRSINRFQAVQAHLVTLAQQAALARMAADVAASGGAGDIAAASVIAASAAAEGARAAHQAHGAMGMTREYPLHWLTRRLWSWRGEYLSTRDTAAELGRRIIAAGPDRLYPAIAAATWEWDT